MPFWFKKRQHQASPPLFEMPDPAAPIEFDEEEEFIVDTESTGGNDPILSRLAQSSLEGSDALLEANILGKLLELSEKRSANGNHKEAALTCVKVIGLSGNTTIPNSFNVHLAWLQLARIHRIYGDARRAKEFFKMAEDKALAMINRQPTEYQEGVTSEWKFHSKEESDKISKM
jgi:hypothetical protein